MTIRQPLFMENDVTEQDADLLRMFTRDFFSRRGGVISENAFKVSQRSSGANDSVDIANGSVIVPGSENIAQGFYYINNDTVINLKMASPADPTNPRIDTIIVRAKDSFYSGLDDDGVLDWIVGTPAPSPVAPDLDALGLENYYKLANIAVGTNDNNITSTDITDLRVSPNTTNQCRATALGGVIACTSTTRPTLPRHGQSIWESDTKRWLFNEGTDTAPDWEVYGESGISQWINYSPQWTPLVGSYTTYGRYTKRGKTVFGIAGFRLTGGTGNVGTSPTLQCRLPLTVASPGPAPLVYMGGGRAFDSSGLFVGNFWSCAAEMRQADNRVVAFATLGTGSWTGVIPFNWGPPAPNIYATADHMSIIFCYEAAA